MMCQKAPLEQEIMMEFAGQAMIVNSFQGDTLYAPIPGSEASNKSRDKYNAYLEYWKHVENREEHTISLIEWISGP